MRKVFVRPIVGHDTISYALEKEVGRFDEEHNPNSPEAMLGNKEVGEPENPGSPKFIVIVVR